ncbi:MAG: GIY-YIG nuclease family protein [Oscillospiraceae bacterium]|jgi:putative endonuclease|nr:GIY-YIG nuclease family protein [Oscillospiraceae bacterium]
MAYCVYILANATNVAIYTGMTNDLARRVYEHKNHLDPGSFTARYSITKLGYFETLDTARAAIEREKQIKSWPRARKNKLVETKNPSWQDLYNTLF